MNNGCENNNITPHMDALNYNEKKMQKFALFCFVFVVLGKHKSYYLCTINRAGFISLLLIYTTINVMNREKL